MHLHEREGGAVPALNVVMLGPPGAGKGTQAERFAEAARPAEDLDRRHPARGGAGGIAARQHRAEATMDAGHLVSDDVMIGIVGERLERADARRGFVLDGFPRTVDQATALDRMMDGRGAAGRARHRGAGGRAAAPPRDAPASAAAAASTRRSTGRRRARSAAAALVTRVDDGDEIVRERLKVYQRQTQADRGVLLGAADVPGHRRQPAADVVTAAMDAAISRGGGGRGRAAVIVCKSPAEIEQMRARQRAGGGRARGAGGDGGAGRDAPRSSTRRPSGGCAQPAPSRRSRATAATRRRCARR